MTCLRFLLCSEMFNCLRSMTPSDLALLSKLCASKHVNIQIVIWLNCNIARSSIVVKYFVYIQLYACKS